MNRALPLTPPPPFPFSILLDVYTLLGLELAPWKATATNERDLLQPQISQKRRPWYDGVHAWPTSLVCYTPPPLLYLQAP